MAAEGIANSLRAKLGNARDRLAAGDVNAARGVLNAFRHEVQAPRGKQFAGPPRTTSWHCWGSADNDGQRSA
jgi:hypothetical protein